MMKMFEALCFWCQDMYAKRTVRYKRNHLLILCLAQVQTTVYGLETSLDIRGTNGQMANKRILKYQKVGKL